MGGTQEDEEAAKKPTLVPMALDGGWGWMVLFGSFMAYFIADGWAYSFGVYYVDLLEYFQESKGKTALVGALMYGVPCLISPIVCAVTNIYGCRIVAILAGFVIGVSFIISSFATSLDFLFITTGILVSIGLAMTYIPSILIVTYYFSRRRGLATGLASTGSGFGTFAFAPLVEFLLHEYTWKGASLILGAIGLNIVVAGALFRKPPMQAIGGNEEEMKLLKTVENKLRKQSHVRVRSGILLPRLHNKFLLDNGRNSTSLLALDRLEARTVLSAYSLHSIDLGSKRNHQSPVNDSPSDCNIEYANKIMKQDTLAYNRTDSKTPSCPDLYLISQSEELNSLHDFDDPLEQNATNTFTMVTSRPNCFQRLWDELVSILRVMLDKSLVKNWIFLIFCMSNFILYLWVGTPYVYLGDFARLHDFKDNSMLFAVIGIARTVGQVVLGYFGDHPRVSTVALYAVSISITGVATVLVPLCNTAALLYLYCTFFGFFVSVTYSLQLMCLVDIVGLERVTSAFGLMQMVQGIATLLGTPVTGKI